MLQHFYTWLFITLSLFLPTAPTAVGDFDAQPQLAGYLTMQEQAGFAIRSAGAFGNEVLFVLWTPSSTSAQDFLLFTYSPDKGRITAEYTFSTTEGHLFSGIRSQDERILLRFTDGYLYLDQTLQQDGVMNDLPPAVQTALSTEPEWAGCYDISDNESTIYYLQDKRALWCYDVATQTTTPLFTAVKLDFEGSYGLFDLQLLPAQNALIMTLSGYSGPIGYYLVSLDAPTQGTQIRLPYDLLRNWSNADCALPLLDTQDASSYALTFLPLDGSRSDLKLTFPITTEQQLRDVALGDALLYNDHSIAYLTRQDSCKRLIRLDYAAGMAQTVAATLHGDLEPIALTDDGKLLFRYTTLQQASYGLSR